MGYVILWHSLGLPYNYFRLIRARKYEVKIRFKCAGTKVKLLNDKKVVEKQ